MITEIQISEQRLLLDRFPCGAGMRYCSLGQKRHFENQSSFESDATSSESKNPITSYPFLTTNSTPQHPRVI